MRAMYFLRYGALLVLVLPSPPAAAQGGTRLTGPEIVQLLAGKRIAIRHNRMIRGTSWDNWDWVQRTDGTVTDLQYFYRSDGSFRRECTNVTSRGERTPCGGISSGVSTGVWEVRGARYCWRELVVAAGREQCLEIERAGARYRFRWPEGASPPRRPAFFDGLEFEVKQQ